MESKCVFCDLISQGKVTFLAEDDQAVAFADISPKAPVHILIVPRKHITSINELSQEEESLIGHLYTVAKQLTKDKQLTGGYRLVINTGPDAGQTVHHVHLHLLGGEPLGKMRTQEAA